MVKAIFRRYIKVYRFTFIALTINFELVKLVGPLKNSIKV